MKLAYLAVPYSSPSPFVREARWHASNAGAARLIREGYAVFAPISQSHPIARDHHLGLDWDSWAALDREMLSRCDEVHVLCIDGWQESKGIKAELAIAEELGLPVFFDHRPLTRNADGE